MEGSTRLDSAVRTAHPFAHPKSCFRYRNRLYFKTISSVIKDLSRQLAYEPEGRVFEDET